MPRRWTLAILSVVLGSLWTLVYSAPPVSGDEKPARKAAPAPKKTVDTKKAASPKKEPAADTAPVKPAAAEGAAEKKPTVVPAADAEPAKPVPAAPAPAAHRLVYKFGAGDVVYYEVENETEITTRYSDVTEVAQNKTETRKHYKVTKVDADGAADLELVIDWVKMTAKFGEDDPGVMLDSLSPDDWPKKFQHILKSIGRVQATMRFAPSGKLLKVHENGPLGAGEAAANPAARHASGESQQTFLVILPDEPIAVGRTWEDRYALQVTVQEKLKQEISMMRTYRLESVEGNLATISFQTAILTPVNNPAISAQLIQRETRGTIGFDIERGLIVSRKVDVDKSVIAPFGAKTAMHAVSRYVERLAPAPATAAKPEGATPAASESK